ncbi:hypothetical protein LINPERHAP2_LOCUS4500 [Linum perenne]
MKQSKVDDDVFKEYVESHPSCAKMNNKPFLRYDDLLFIFGKNRATGSEAMGANEDILSPHETSTKRKNVFSHLEKIEGLSRIQAIAASRRLVKDDKELQLFFYFEDDADRLAFVLDLLG